MAQKITQLRFGTINDNVTADQLTSSEGLRFINLEQLTIETLPGIAFYVNDSSIAMYIGNSGIYTVELQGSPIASLRFDAMSIQNLVEYNTQHADKPMTLLISLIYEEEKEDGEESSTSEL